VKPFRLIVRGVDGSGHCGESRNVNVAFISFSYNMYKMMKPTIEIDIKEKSTWIRFNQKYGHRMQLKLKYK
jgi:hypothetical protein